MCKIIKIISEQKSLTYRDFTVTFSAIFFAFIFAISSLGYLYISMVSKHEYSDSTYMNSLKPTVTKINTKNFDDSEIEIFRLILRNTNTLSASEAYNLATVIHEESYKKGIDPSVVLGVIMVESRFRPKAISNKGAMGLMQLMPSTGRYIAKQEGIKINSSTALYDPEINVKLGIAYLSELENRYRNMNQALGAYNFGPNKFNRLIRRSKNKNLTPRYVSKVLKFKNSFEDELINLRES